MLLSKIDCLKKTRVLSAKRVTTKKDGKVNVSPSKRRMNTSIRLSLSTSDDSKAVNTPYPPVVNQRYSNTYFEVKAKLISDDESSWDSCR